MAAAYAALVSLFNDLELIHNHPRHSFSFENKQIQSLLQIVTFLIEFVESYDNAHGPSKEAAQLLERPITRAAHAAQEVIESHVVDQIRSGSTLDGKRRSRFLLDVQKVIEHMEFARRKAIKVSKPLNQPTYSAAAVSSSSSSSSAPLTSDKTSMVGFDDVLLQLLDLLTGYSPSRRVIPIVGTGGIGKTTLAKYAFEHPLIAEHFDVRLWATISQEYVVEDILLRLLSREKKSNSETAGELGEQLHKMLYGRTYLVVLDDMWSVEAWEQITLFWPDTSRNGSRVVVTTRLSNVGDCIGSSSLAISFLAEDKSWDLFCEKAFGGHGCPVELEDVGKKIVKKCRGLPLAIVVVAGHLGKSSRKKEYWENVANNMNSVLNSKENKQLLDILSISYSHLPARLKPCFIYMGTRREDEDIDMGDLIKRWIAEGFLKPCAAKNLEEIATDYLNDLIDRNLIFPITSLNKRYCYGEMKHVGIHDVLRELCIKVAEKEKFFYRADERVICREREGDVLDGRRSASPVVRCLEWKEGDEQSFDLRLLRVLDKKERREYANEVDEGFLEDDQVNLRYVNYKENGTNHSYAGLYLGPKISLFWNLQTLIIDLGLGGNCVAPYEFWEMLQLRNLEVDSGVNLPEPLPSDNLEHVMRNLQTLKRVENLRLSDEVCKRIANIKELELRYFDTAVEFPSSDYCLHNLACFPKLESLDCIFASYDRIGLKSEWREFFLSLKLPTSLKKLRLSGSGLDWEEITMMVGSLPNLETLELLYESVKGSSWTLVEETFPRLKYLRIRHCDDLVEWNADSSNFPVLEYLHLGFMLGFDELPSFIGEIPTLGCIHLSFCSESLMISAARIVMESQEEYGNHDLQLQIFCERDKAERFNKKLQEEGLTINNLHLNDHELYQYLLHKMESKHNSGNIKKVYPPCLYIGSQISLFWNLQALNIHLGGRSCSAPYEFWEMLQLRNLDVSPTIYLPDPLLSENLEQVMQNLQTLKRVENLRLSDEVCKRIPNIKELQLAYSDTAVEFPSSDYCLHNLVCFRKLESLELDSDSDTVMGLKSEWRKFGLSLKLSTSLKKLFLLHCGLDWEEITMMVGYLPHLERLDLEYKAVKGSSWTLVEETFPRLKYLTIWDCDDLVEWNADSSNFPVLEYLSLGYMLRLDELPSFIGEIPTLGCILLTYCSESLMISAAIIVMESQEELGNDDLKLEIYCERDEAERFNKKLQEEGLPINNLHLNFL